MRYFHYPPKLIKLIQGMLRIYEKERLSWQEVFERLDDIGLGLCNPYDELSQASTDDSLNDNENDDFYALKASMRNLKVVATKEIPRLEPAKKAEEPAKFILQKKYESTYSLEKDLNYLNRSERAEMEFYEFYRSKIDMIMINYFALQRITSLKPEDRLPLKLGISLTISLFLQKSLIIFLKELLNELLDTKGKMKEKFKDNWNFFSSSNKFKELVADQKFKLERIEEKESLVRLNKSHEKDVVDELPSGKKLISSLNNPNSTFNEINYNFFLFTDEFMNLLRPFIEEKSTRPLSVTQRKILGIILFASRVTLNTSPNEYPFKNIPNFKKELEAFQSCHIDMLNKFLCQSLPRKK